MPINPIKEQRKYIKQFNIGYYSENSEFIERLISTLNSKDTNYNLISLNNLDNDTLQLFLSIIDEVIFDTNIPEKIMPILQEQKINSKTTTIDNIENTVQNLEDTSKLTLELKKEKNNEFEKELKFIMQIISILENKDPYTKDHSARVAKYSLAIAEKYFDTKYDKLYGNLQQDNIQFNELKHQYIIKNLNLTMLSAWAHDIGKNNIAQTLLNKDSKLTDSEYDIMKMHTDFGANIIRKILGNEEFAEIIENHHERIDGFGYHNLTEFSDISKIIAIADTFDAITTTRPYTTKTDSTSKNKLKTVEEAITELQISSHYHFDIEENRMSQQLDTEITDIFVQMLKKELDLLKENKLDNLSLLSGGIDTNGFLKAGFWDDKTQEYVKDKSVNNYNPNFKK